GQHIGRGSLDLGLRPPLTSQLHDFLKQFVVAVRIDLLQRDVGGQYLQFSVGLPFGEDGSHYNSRQKQVSHDGRERNDAGKNEFCRTLQLSAK
ncbi:MAG TPA: hypothetical protein VGJ20_01925, partial [Xanthobacteraceae bacterium]